jgi:hypothetical protein
MGFLRTIAESLQAHPGLTVGLHLAATALFAWLARDEVRAGWRLTGRDFRLGTLVAMALALAASAVVVPGLTRHGWEGHEAIYLDLFEDRPSGESVEDSPLLVAPLPAAVYTTMGKIPGLPPLSMVLLNLALGALAVGAAAWNARLLTGDDRTGIVAGLLTALHPLLAFWSSSAYQVILPCALGQLSITALLLARQRPSTRTLLLAAALWGLAVASRVEYVLLAPALVALWLLGGGRAVREFRRWLPALGVGAALGALHLLPLGLAAVTRDTGEPLAYYLGMVRLHLLWSDVWDPYDALWTWPALGIGFALLGLRGREGWAALAGVGAIALAFHLPYCAFWDYATRHTLLPVAAVATVVAAGIAGTWERGVAGRVVAGALAIGCGVPLVLGLGMARQRYYADADVLPRVVRGVDWDHPLALEPYVEQGCYLVTEHPALWDAYPTGSHVNIADPLEGPQIWAAHDGCVLWLMDADDVRWTSRDVMSRAWKLEHLFDWEPVGSIELDDGHRAAVRRLLTPP